MVPAAAMLSSTAIATSTSIIARRSSVASISSSGAARMSTRQVERQLLGTHPEARPAAAGGADGLLTGPSDASIDAGSCGDRACSPGGARVWPNSFVPCGSRTSTYRPGVSWPAWPSAPNPPGPRAGPPRVSARATPDDDASSVRSTRSRRNDRSAA